MVRTVGSSEAGKLERQRRVLMFYVRQMTPEETAAQLHVTPRTIYRDLEELGPWLRQQNDRNQLYCIGEAFALQKALLRETWILYHRPPPRDHNGIAQDDTVRKLWALDRVMKAAQALEHLAGFNPSEPVPVPALVESKRSEEAVAAFIETLPPPLRNNIIEHLEGGPGIQKTDS